MTITSYLKKALFLTLIITSSISSKIIMWDLGNVLFGFSKMRMVFHLGVFRCLGHSSAEMRTIISDVLNKARENEPRNCTVPDDKGSHLSNILCDYQAGIHPSSKLLQEALDAINLLDSQGYFVSNRQKRFTEKVIRSLFDVQLTARFMRPIKQGVKLLKECSEKVDAQGNKCHEMVILSNWDAESFPPFKEKNHKVFHYIKPENVIISASFGHLDGLKPSPWLFNHMVDLKQVPASEFIFIDDQPCNIAAARACGMNAILVEDGNYKKVRAELQRLEAL